MTKGEKLAWLMYRLTQFREDIKVAEWQDKGKLFKSLQKDIIERLIDDY